MHGNVKPFGEGLEETAAYVARTKPGYDDSEWPVRRHALPPSDREIKLAFAVMQEMVDRIEQIEPTYCDAATATAVHSRPPCSSRRHTSCK
jgi:hypothetical protein